jgi:predicted nuclease with TOPRIM domain
MNIEPENLTPVFLRRLDTKMDDVRADMQEVKERLGLLEAGYASVSRRLDRALGDIEQIKRRLDIADAPV